MFDSNLSINQSSNQSIYLSTNALDTERDTKVMQTPLTGVHKTMLVKATNDNSLRKKKSS